MVYLIEYSSAWPKGKPALLEAQGARRQLVAKSGLQNLHLLKYGAIFEVGSSRVPGSLAHPFLGHPGR